jgi:xanthine dehydrogenase accessory factor
MALLEALKSPAFYIGAIGSKKNNDARRQRLGEFDLSPREIERLRGPVGLRIGSKTPPEIAIAILAEMTAVKNGTEISGTQDTSKQTKAAQEVAANS